jgi:hypothetical protein
VLLDELELEVPSELIDELLLDSLAPPELLELEIPNELLELVLEEVLELDELVELLELDVP